MKAEELRLYNLIYGIEINADDIALKRVCSVTTLDVSFDNDNFIHVYSDDKSEQFDYFLPIPLTEEWLLKLGFHQKNGYGFIKKYLLGNLFYSVETKEHFMFQYYELRIKINYVHQLQNLYFALTGEELTLNQES